MSRNRLAAFFGALAVSLALWGGAASAQGSGLTALARVDPSSPGARDMGAQTELALTLSQAVPFRIFTLDAPMRLVVDFAEADWTGVDGAALDRSDRVEAIRVGGFRPGWSRMVVDLAEPVALSRALLDTSEQGNARLLLTLVPVDEAAFAAGAGAPEDALIAPEPRGDLPPPKRRQTGEGPLVVVLDPGHGGIDPGAVAGEVNEADLMLTFARELQEMLLRAGGFRVVLTREEDVFVSLEERLSIAHAAGADVFISLHADALAEGRASGATVYTLAERASDEASRKLAERHDRADLLAGLDLSEQDDMVVGVLMDLARTETAPRAERLADALVAELAPNVGMHKRPKMQAAFSVLKAPDIPSVLLEIGFLSSAKDRQKLVDPAWRARAAWAIRDALKAWAAEDAAEAQLLRQ